MSLSLGGKLRPYEMFQKGDPFAFIEGSVSFDFVVGVTVEIFLIPIELGVGPITVLTLYFSPNAITAIIMEEGVLSLNEGK